MYHKVLLIRLLKIAQIKLRFIFKHSIIHDTGTDTHTIPTNCGILTANADYAEYSIDLRNTLQVLLITVNTSILRRSITTFRDFLYF